MITDDTVEIIALVLGDAGERRWHAGELSRRRSANRDTQDELAEPDVSSNGHVDLNDAAQHATDDEKQHVRHCTNRAKVFIQLSTSLFPFAYVSLAKGALVRTTRCSHFTDLKP